MFLLKKLLSALLLPPAGPLVLAAIGIWLMHRESRRENHAQRHPLGRRVGLCLATASIGGLFALSLPLVSYWLMAPLQRMASATAPALARAQAIVVLGGGNRHNSSEYGGDTVGRYTLERIRYAARLARQTGLPLLVTGGTPAGGRPEGETMAAALREDFATPVRWIENRSLDTAENAAYSAPMLKAAGIQRIALVSHAWHLPRAVPLFERQGFVVLPAPTAFHSLPQSPWARWLPSSRALEASTDALAEWLGRLFNQLLFAPAVGNPSPVITTKS